MSDYLPQIANINVLSGSGSGLINQGGLVFAIGVIPPNGAQYDISGFDSDGFLLYFGDDVTGRINLAIRALIYGPHTIQISEASVDGVYKVKLWYENW